MDSSTVERELLEFLRAVEAGTIALRSEQLPQDIYAGNVTYLAANGWTISVFNDVNEWDYIDRIGTSDGRIFDFDALDEMPALRDYQPTDELAWSRYRIPGYCSFRCELCGRLLTREELGTKPDYFCPSCRPSPSPSNAPA